MRMRTQNGVPAPEASSSKTISSKLKDFMLALLMLLAIPTILTLAKKFLKR